MFGIHSPTNHIFKSDDMNCMLIKNGSTTWALAEFVGQEARGSWPDLTSLVQSLGESLWLTLLHVEKLLFDWCMQSRVYSPRVTPKGSTLMRFPHLKKKKKLVLFFWYSLNKGVFIFFSPLPFNWYWFCFFFFFFFSLRKCLIPFIFQS